MMRRHPTAPRVSAVLLPCILFGAVACSPGAVRVAWGISFATPEVSARAVRVAASIHDGTDCTGATRYATVVTRADAASVQPPALSPGTYTFCATAIDDACIAFAAGQLTVALRSTTTRVDVVVEAAAETPTCPATSCTHGACVGGDGGVPDAAPVDGGPRDAGIPDAGEDTGVGLDAGCGPYIVSPPTSVACASFTLSCIDTCGDDACVTSCIDSDPSPAACGTCFDDAHISCWNASGCQAVWDAYVCCTHGCADPTAASCCPPQTSAYDSCGMPYDSTCIPMDSVCFP